MSDRSKESGVTAAQSFIANPAPMMSEAKPNGNFKINKVDNSFVQKDFPDSQL